MKNLIFLFSIVLVLFAANTSGQTALGRGDGLFILGSEYGYVWGTSTKDTLVASDTLQTTIRIKGDGLQNLKLGLYVTKVSGTVTNNFFIQGSIDGTNFANVDTIALSNVSTGLSTDYSNLSRWTWPYLRVKGIAGATAQKAWYKLYIVKRDE